MQISGREECVCTPAFHHLCPMESALYYQRRLLNPPVTNCRNATRMHAPINDMKMLPKNRNDPRSRALARIPPMIEPSKPTIILPRQPKLRPRTTQPASAPAIKPTSSHATRLPGCRIVLISTVLMTIIENMPLSERALLRNYDTVEYKAYLKNMCCSLWDIYVA